MATAHTIANVVEGMGPAKQFNINKNLYIRVQTLNFDKIATAAGSTLAANDTFQIMPLRAGETVLQVGVQVLTASTDAATADIGFTGGDVDFFVDGAALNDTTFPAGAGGVYMPMYMAAADTLDMITLSESAAGGVCKVFAIIAKI